MKKVLFILAAACMAFASCSNDAETGTPAEGTAFVKGQKVTLSVSAGDNVTRVTGTDANNQIDFAWEADDKIQVKVGSATATFALASGAGTASATFSGIMPASGTSFDIQYPVTATAVDLSTQAYTAGKVPDDMMSFRATGCTLGTAASLAPDFSVLQLNFTGSQAIKKIVVETVDATEFKSYTLNFSNAVTLTSTKQAFYVVTNKINEKLKVTVYDNASPAAEICNFTTTNAINLSTGNCINMTAKEVKKVKSVLLLGDFSISANETVKFSQGNLYYDGSTGTWGFEANQYDYRTYAGKNSCINGTVSTTGTPANNWGTFGWVGASSTVLTGDLTKYGMSTSKTNSDYGTSTSDALKADWANISTLPQTAGRKWKTLTGGDTGEWYYLLNTRSGDKAPEIGTQTDARYAEVKVNGICGLLIFPDTFTWPTTGITTAQPTTFNASSSNWNDRDYTAAEFDCLESAGCVFLPAAGYRYDSTIDFVGSFGYYCSSTPYSSDSNNAYGLYFHDSSVNPADIDNRYYGRSVRLVSAAQ